MAYHGHAAGATFVPGLDDDYYMPARSPELVSPEPQRFQPEMSNQIAGGIDAVQNLSLNAKSPPQNYTNLARSEDAPHFSPFPKLIDPPPNVPPSDEELESTLENARTLVLNSNDPEMQLAWASDALIYVGVCADNEERIAAAKPNAARSSTPRIEHQLKEDAMSVVSFLAEQKHPKAEFLRAMWLEWGRFGQREDKKEAFRCYSRAADRGYARAEYRIGMLYESYNDPIKALRHYNRGVDAGDAASCYRLGMMTLRGQCGQAQDYHKAVDLIRRSAEAADENAAQGAYVYGMLLCRGLPQLSVPDGYLAYDERQARINIEKAAYLKFAKAQVKMGAAYELGSLGCDFNPALSVHYNALASKQGEAEADMALSKWFLVGSEGLFAKNEELAYTYAERAAQGQLATGEFALGYFNEIGMHVPVNLASAMEWYQKAAAHGNEDAKGRIAGLESKQVLSKKDHENVAISRIKSQYGSVRGDRPDRFRQQQGSNAPGYGSGAGLGLQTQPPGRATMPYPEHDMPLPPAGTLPRPATVTPYPMGDDLPRNQTPRMPSGGSYNPQQPSRPATTVHPDARSGSAFQMNSDPRSHSVVNQPPAGQYGGRPPYAGGPPPRPMTAQPYGNPGHGPGGMPYNGNRVPSGQQGQPNYPPHQSAPRPPPGPQGQRPQGPPQGHADFGYAAPPDDRRNYAQGHGRPPPNGSGYPPAKSPALRQSDSMPNFNHGPASSGRVATPSSGYAPRTSSAQKPPNPRVQQPPSKPSGRTPAAIPPQPKPQAQSASSKPPKAAKTFDEMGVPSQNKDGECVMM